jgi:ABC-type dipeptide/oligopeptide/nickel transport system ATPase component
LDTGCDPAVGRVPRIGERRLLALPRLADVSIAVNEGEVHYLLGDNGGGKTSSACSSMSEKEANPREQNEASSGNGK